tara:strand:+ start:160 stop:411 length:252 start_codon:yes stop_codon:yes gene_type:complete
MGVVGAALRGFGKALGRGTKEKAKKKFDTKLKVFGNAAKSNELTQVSKKLKKTADEVKKSMTKATKNIKMLGKAPIIGFKKKD